MKDKVFKTKSYILIFAAALALLLAIPRFFGAGRESTLVLEQSVRCGTQEHRHGQDCYIGDILICEQKNHSHGQSCYLVRLEDNDINELLTLVDAHEERSLEAVIADTLAQAADVDAAAALSGSTAWTATDDGDVLTNDDIVMLNHAITDGVISSGVVMNESLSTSWSSSQGMSESQIIRMLGSVGGGSASTYAVGGTPSSDMHTVNFYILLDGKVTFVNSKPLTIYSNYYDYCSYSDAALAYTSEVVTRLTSNNIGSRYYFRYNTSGDTSNFGSTASNQSSRVYFGSTDNAHYAILTTRSGNGWNPTYTPVPFFTVKLDYSSGGGTDQVKYVEEGLDSGLSPDTTNYLWYSSETSTTPLTESEISAALSDISDTTTLYARPKSHSVTYTVGGSEVHRDSNLAHNSEYVIKTAIEGVDLSAYGAWRDTDSGTVYRFNGSAAQLTIILNSNKNFAALKNVTASFYGTEDEDITALEGEEITLPELPEGYVWNDGENSYAGGSRVTLNGDTTFTSVPGCVVSFTYANGTTSAQVYGSGDKVTIPALSQSGNYWVDEDGNEYSAGQTVTVTKDIHFTERSAITIKYTVNFPSAHSEKTLYPTGGLGPDFSGKAVGVPVLSANSSSTYTISNFKYSNAPHTAEKLNYRQVFYQYNQAPAYEYRSVYLLGWQVSVNGTTELYQPGEPINWAKLEALAAAGNGTINFTGLWEHDELHTVTFYINYSAKAADASGNYISGNASDYTPEVFSGHLFGLPSGISAGDTANKYYGISGANAIKSVDADTNIRRLYGTGVSYDGINNILGGTISGGNANYAATLYMTDFPTDEEALAKIKEWAEDGTLTQTLKYDDGQGNADDVPYNTSGSGRDYYNLDTDHYAIRWYVFKSQYDGWHVDGRLIKKVGTVKINKNFGGNSTLTALAIEQAEKDYEAGKPFIIAVCEGYYKDADDASSFVAYDDPRRVELWFTPQTTEQPYGYSYDAATDTYSWVIGGVEANEEWVVTENPPQLPEGAMDMSEWVWVDSFNGTTDSGVSISTTVTGITHAADSYSEDWLTVDFSNLYHRSNTILIRKIDGTTMSGLSGAVFNIYDHNGRLMYFNYNVDAGIYEYTPGTSGICDLATGENGFLEYTLGNFSYESGNITVREKTPPHGYGIVGDVVMGFTDDKQTIGIVASESTEAASYAHGVLTIKNYSDGKANVTASKVWDCDKAYYDGLTVRFELFANGKIASAAIPGFSNYGSYYIYLDEYGAYFETNPDGTPKYVSTTPWSYTWHDLPTVLSGKGISYTIVETKVGDEVADSSGNFPNWICDTLYNDVTTDQLGNQTVEIALRNTPNRAMIRLTKYDMSGSILLPGAQFTLSELDSSGRENGTSYTYITDQHGVITFDNLKYETWYKLSEDKAPEGYIGMSSAVYVQLAPNGVVTVTTSMSDPTKTSSYAFYPNQANNVTVLNTYAGPLPETGGGGTYGYILGGALLMAAAAMLMIYNTSRRKGEAPYV